MWGVIVFHYIYEDDQGFTRLDQYFSYLRGISDQMPPVLRGFACDESRYDLKSESSLHDAWVESIFYENNFSPDSNFILFSLLRIKLLLAKRNCVLSLSYGSVVAFECNCTPTLWPECAVDLLVHEIRAESDGFFSHNLQFDRNIWLRVVFRDFSWHTEEGRKA